MNYNNIRQYVYYEICASVGVAGCGGRAAQQDAPPAKPTIAIESPLDGKVIEAGETFECGGKVVFDQTVALDRYLMSLEICNRSRGKSVCSAYKIWRISA